MSYDEKPFECPDCGSTLQWKWAEFKGWFVAVLRRKRAAEKVRELKTGPLAADVSTKKVES